VSKFDGDGSGRFAVAVVFLLTAVMFLKSTTICEVWRVVWCVGGLYVESKGFDGFAVNQACGLLPSAPWCGHYRQAADG
jgi:hypothetical protein